MSIFEDNLQLALRDLADDVGLEPALRWAGPAPRASAPRTRLALAAVAVVVLAALLTTSVLVLRRDRAGIVEPVQRPPRVVRLSAVDDSSPGPAVLALSLADTSEPSYRPTYLVALGSDEAVELPLQQIQAMTNYSRAQLSADGRSYLVQDELPFASLEADLYPTMTLVDLTTGKRDDLGGARGFCPEISPDGRTVAFLSGTGVRLVDVVTGRLSRVGTAEVRSDAVSGCAGDIGWSPDGRVLAVGRPGHLESRTSDSTRVVGLDGRLVTDLPGHLVNGSMSWSPDSRRLLLYTPQTGEYAIGSLDGSPPVTVPKPRDVESAEGWAGRRIVWLRGSGSRSELVTTDVEGRHLRVWTRLDVGNHRVLSVQWSRDLRDSVR